MSTNSGRKEVLITQFAANYNEENWFKTLKQVLDNVTVEEFNFKPGKDINTIRQLVNHLIFWNERWLYRFKETPLPPFKKENDATFDDTDENTKPEDLIKKLFEVMDIWETELKNCKEEKMEEDRMGRKDIPDEDIPKEKIEPWWENMSNVNIHNSYHLGQIILLRKLFKNKDN